MNNTPAGFHRHPNGGGLVQDTAHVEASAFVGPNAQVAGDAQVTGNARVAGDAQVAGNAQVYGNAQVAGNAWEFSPLYIQGSRESVTLSSLSTVSIGCQTHTFAQWKKSGVAVARANKYTKAQIEEYREYFKLAEKTARRLRRTK